MTTVVEEDLMMEIECSDVYSLDFVKKYLVLEMFRAGHFEFHSLNYQSKLCDVPLVRELN